MLLKLDTQRTCTCSHNVILAFIILIFFLFVTTLDAFLASLGFWLRDKLSNKFKQRFLHINIVCHFFDHLNLSGRCTLLFILIRFTYFTELFNDHVIYLYNWKQRSLINSLIQKCIFTFCFSIADFLGEFDCLRTWFLDVQPYFLICVVNLKAYALQQG